MDILRSKKFQAALVGMVVSVAARVGLELDETAVLATISPILAYIAGQGIADHGKEAAKVQKN